MTTFERRACACAHGGTFAAAEAAAHYPPDLRIEPVHLDLALRLAIAQERLDGTMRMRLRGRAGATEVVLDALDFVAISVDGAVGRYDGTRLVVRFDPPFEEGEERTIGIDWTVERPVSGLHFSRPSAERPDAGVYAVTDHETERARHWLPTVDHPSVRPTLSFALTAESHLVALANGAFEGETTNDDGTKTTRFRLDHPCPSYLTCFAVGDFVRWDGESVDGIEVAAFAPRPFTAAHLERSFGPTSRMLRWMQAKLGVPYPYPKYYQFAATGIGGAMENISLVSWDDRFLLDEALETEERQLIDVINVHEMAHAWFGDHVVCRDFAHSWLKESWATYVENVYLEEHHGADAAIADRYANAEAYFAEHDGRYKRPIVTRRFDSSWDLFDMHLYPGGALRLHMLRGELGDEVFWRGVRRYLERHGRGTVETDDFRRALEEASGRSLGRFFDQWLMSPGFPELAVTATYDAETRQLRLVVEQKQIDPSAGIPCFEFTLDVLVDDGAEVRRRSLRIDRAHAELVVPANADPRAIVLDPDYRLLARIDFDPGIERTLHALREGHDVRVRMDAGRRLVTAGARKGMAALVAAFAHEADPLVRARWATALGEAGTPAALEALLEVAGSESDPRVAPKLFAALGRYRDPRVQALVESALARGLGPRATEAAYGALGAQRERGFGPTLRHGIHREGIAGFAAAGALRALGATRSEDAAPLLLDALAVGGCPWRARPAAAGGLGALATMLAGRAQERALEALIDALRDPDARVRAAAAAALTQLADPRGLDAVRRYATTLTPQERVRVERAVRDTKPAAAAAAKSTEERLDTLAKQLDQLQRKLEALEAASKERS